MGGYVIHFMVYTLAMSGLICFALFVYKKIMAGTFNPKGSKMLSIEETLSINPRKSLMIVKAGNERFLIASDVDKTSLISKLDDGANVNRVNKTVKSNFENVIEQVQEAIPTYEEQKPISNVHPLSKEPVHLEVISQKNPAAVGLNRKSSYTSRNYVRNHKTKGGLSAIRGLADKVGEI